MFLLSLEILTSVNTELSFHHDKNRLELSNSFTDIFLGFVIFNMFSLLILPAWPCSH